MKDKLKVAVLLENHPYDVIGFQKMLESFDGCECYPQPLDLFVRDGDGNNEKYDTVIYYNMNIPLPKEDSPLDKYLKEGLGKDGQGIIILHHALLSFRDLPLYTQVCGLGNRGGGGIFKYTQNQKVDAKIVDTSHPITAGVGDFSLIDETYILGEPEEPGNHILITTDNETSIKNIAWVREYKGSRVFSFASGHDNRVYANPAFRKILHNAIFWTAGKI
ncbi:MAG: ThuA domain-containing protein [Oscillospiraceae bacterium]|nr:ThuA domain-containing protein [Oscillospiraceae bacterium]